MGFPRPRRNIPTHARAVVRTMLLTCGGCPLVMGGCSGEDPAKAAVVQAGVILESSSEPTNSSWTLDEQENAKFRAVISELSDQIGERGYASAAAAITGTASEALGSSEVGAFQQAVRDTIALQADLRAESRAWIGLRASAQASGAYDPRIERSRLDQTQAAIERERADIRERKAEVDERISTLVETMEAFNSESKEARDRAGELMLRASTMSATQAAELSDEIREFSRAADKAEFEAERRRSRAAQLEPVSAVLLLDLQRLSQQETLVTEARERVASLEADADRDRREAQAKADESEARIDQIVASMNDRVSGELLSLETAAREAITRGIREAGRAKNAGRDAANLTRASSQHRMGDLARDLAWVHASFADDLERLGGLGLGSASGFTSQAQAQRTLADAAEQAARDAYGQAASTLRSIRVRGEERDRLADLADKLEALSEGRAFGEPEPEAPAAPAQPDPDAGEPAPAPADDAAGTPESEG